MSFARHKSRNYVSVPLIFQSISRRWLANKQPVVQATLLNQRTITIKMQRILRDARYLLRSPTPLLQRVTVMKLCGRVLPTQDCRTPTSVHRERLVSKMTMLIGLIYHRAIFPYRRSNFPHRPYHPCLDFEDPRSFVSRLQREQSGVLHHHLLAESIDRSLPCASPYFTQTLRPPFDNPNNATNLTPNEAAALSNTANRAVIFTTGSQRPRSRHRHPAGPWAQQSQQQQQQMQNFMLSSPGGPAGATVFTPGGHAYNMTAHSFEIPMVISTTATADIPLPMPPPPPSSTSNDPSQQRQQAATNDAEQFQMVTLPS